MADCFRISDTAQPPFALYRRSGQKLLRCGYTTGTCAALAAKAAAELLLCGVPPAAVRLLTPKGISVELAPAECRRTENGAVASIVKDGGDDADATTGLWVTAEVTLCKDSGVQLAGGEGIGKVTKPGLDQPVGAWAINRVPRQMIAQALAETAGQNGYEGGFRVVLSIPGGAEAAKKTFNPLIGVEGGLSVIGTSGIVEPMSQQAILDTIQLELNQALLQGKRLILVPGNYGLDYLQTQHPALESIPRVKCSNFIGDALDMAAAGNAGEVLVFGHIGKLVKLAGGIMNTHSHTADCRAELFCAHAAVCGASRALCAALMQAATTDACIALLDEAALRQPVTESLLCAIERHLLHRAAGKFRVGAVLFSNRYGFLGKTRQAEEILLDWEA